MAYYQNNLKIHKERDVKIIKRNMQRKLDLVQEQLSGAKFGHLAAVAAHVGPKEGIMPRISNADEVSSEDEIAPIPYLRKAISSYNPELVEKEEKELEKKRLELEKTEKDLELFQEFTEDEQKELAQLDRLTRLYLFLRRKITNPIIS